MATLQQDIITLFLDIYLNFCVRASTFFASVLFLPLKFSILIPDKISHIPLPETQSISNDV